jgi:hypothetical protein
VPSPFLMPYRHFILVTLSSHGCMELIKCSVSLWLKQVLAASLESLIVLHSYYNSNSHVELVIWSTSSLVVIGVPLLILFIESASWVNLSTLSGGQGTRHNAMRCITRKRGPISIVAVLAYIIAWLLLLALVVSSLRHLPSDALIVVPWTTFILGLLHFISFIRSPSFICRAMISSFPTQSLHFTSSSCPFRFNSMDYFLPSQTRSCLVHLSSFHRCTNSVLLSVIKT